MTRQRLKHLAGIVFSGAGGCIAVLGLFVAILLAMDSSLSIMDAWPLIACFAGLLVWIVVDRWLYYRGRRS